MFQLTWNVSLAPPFKVNYSCPTVNTIIHAGEAQPLVQQLKADVKRLFNVNSSALKSKSTAAPLAGELSYAKSQAIQDLAVLYTRADVDRNMHYDVRQDQTHLFTSSGAWPQKPQSVKRS